MNGKTHKLGGVCTGISTSIIMMQPPFNSEKLFLAGVLITGSVIGSLIPDIDHKGSTMGKKHKVTSHVINGLFGHRGVTHAPIIHCLIYFLLVLFSESINGYTQLIYLAFVTGLFVGGLSHLVLDMITVQGIPLLYPFSKSKYRILKLSPSKNKQGKNSFKKSPTEIAVEFFIILSTFVVVYLKVFK